MGKGMPFADFTNSLKSLSDSIGSTFETACGLFGENQPTVEQGPDFSVRIEAMCAS